MSRRTLERAPSAPSTYLARTTRSSPGFTPASGLSPVRFRVTVTGCSPSPTSSFTNSQPQYGSVRDGAFLA